MFARWIGEWPEVGLDIEYLTRWYRSEMERQIKPDMKVNGLLLSSTTDRYRGALSQTGRRTSAAIVGRRVWIGSPISSSFQKRPAYAKPDPRIFRDALIRAGLSKPETGHVHWGQSSGGHRRSQALRNANCMGEAGSSIPVDLCTGPRHRSRCTSAKHNRQRPERPPQLSE